MFENREHHLQMMRAVIWAAEYSAAMTETGRFNSTDDRVAAAQSADRAVELFHVPEAAPVHDAQALASLGGVVVPVPAVFLAGIRDDLDNFGPPPEGSMFVVLSVRCEDFGDLGKRGSVVNVAVEGLP